MSAELGQLARKPSLVRTIALVLLALFVVYEYRVATGHVQQRFATIDVIVLAILLIVAFPEIWERLRKISISEKGFTAEFQELKEKQARQQEEIDSLRFLLFGYLNQYELRHLHDLRGSDPVPFDIFPPALRELEHLHKSNLIEIIPAAFKKHAGDDLILQEHPEWGDETDLPEHIPDLHEFYKVTPTGERYLELREQMKKAEKAP